MPRRPGIRKSGRPGRANCARQPSFLGSRGGDDGRNQGQTDTRPGTARLVRATSPMAVRPIPGVPRRAGGTDRGDVRRKEPLLSGPADDRHVPGPFIHRSGRHEPGGPALRRLPHGRGRVDRPPVRDSRIISHTCPGQFDSTRCTHDPGGAGDTDFQGWAAACCPFASGARGRWPRDRPARNAPLPLGRLGHRPHRPDSRPQTPRGKPPAPGRRPNAVTSAR